MNDWNYYGRLSQEQDVARVLDRGRWFFAKVSGRRRIGKTTLVRRVLRELDRDRLVFYVQIPDSEEAGVLSAVNDALDAFEVSTEQFPRPRTLPELAKTWEAMAEAGYVVVMDEFQYFNRKGFQGFCSFLQGAVDRLSEPGRKVPGGWLALGSIHTEMTALLEDRSAPLYNRVTDSLEINHLDVGSVVEILRDHTDGSPARLLFLWSLFEGVPKFYRDCWEQESLGASRKELLRRIFFESSSPLRTEAENWFLRELRGRYDVALKFVSRQPGRPYGELTQVLRDASGDPKLQAGPYLSALTERYRLIERRSPIFAKPNSRQGRYYLTDNFLRSWLAALANPVASTAIKPVEGAVGEADKRLREVEGASLERLTGMLYEERSRKGVGDFPLTRRIQGYWNRSDTEIDLVAVNEDERRIRLGSCKRTPGRLVADVTNFRGHVERFLDAFPRYRDWKVERVGVAPRLDKEQRKILRRYDVIPEDLNDLVKNLPG